MGGVSFAFYLATLSAFSMKVRLATALGLEMAYSGIPLGDWSGSNATDKLHETIKEFTASSDRQSRSMIRLTWAVLGLTVLMLIGLVVQIWLAVKALPS